MSQLELPTPGNTSFVPSGDHDGPPPMRGTTVTRPVPSAAITTSSESDQKASFVPSGDHAGSKSQRPSLGVSCALPLPSGFMTQMLYSAYGWGESAQAIFPLPTIGFGPGSGGGFPPTPPAFLLGRGPRDSGPGR